jgi:hypothetical protein
MERPWQIQSFDVDHPKKMHLTRLDWAGFSFSVLMALRATMGVGLGVAVYLSPTVNSPIQGTSWLLLFLGMSFAVPLFGIAMSIIPAILVGTCFIYMYSAVAGAYPCAGLWNILTGALVFIGAFIGLWPKVSGATTMMMWYLGPFMLIVVTNAGGTAAIPDPVNDLGTGIVLTIWVAIAIGLATCFLVPMTATRSVKHKLTTAAKDLELLYNCLKEIFHTPMSLRMKSQYSSLRKHVQSDIQKAGKTLPFVQAELFFADVSVYQQRYHLLQRTLMVVQ